MPKHIFILEGPDGAGKSTLANWLIHRARDGILFHQGPWPAGVDIVADVFQKLQRASSPRYPSTVVFDRLHHGELVYGPVFRDHSRITMGDARSLDRLAREVGAFRILCLPPWEVVVRNFRRSADLGEELFAGAGAIANLHDVYLAYQKLYADGFFDFQYDYTKSDPNGAMAKSCPDAIGLPTSILGRPVVYREDLPDGELRIGDFRVLLEKEST